MGSACIFRLQLGTVWIQEAAHVVQEPFMYYCNEKYESHDGDIEPDAYMEFTLALADSFLTDRFLTAHVWNLTKANK